MLGELALVPKNSGIAESGLLYYNTLFDENASCHVAIGAGFSGCIKGFEDKTLDELKEMGMNDSVIHVDFMIGTDDLCITGYKDGKAIPVFVNGMLALDRLEILLRPTAGSWFGVTYREDRPAVAEKLAALHRAGVYPARLNGKA